MGNSETGHIRSAPLRDKQVNATTGDARLTGGDPDRVGVPVITTRRFFRSPCLSHH